MFRCIAVKGVANAFVQIVIKGMFDWVYTQSKLKYCKDHQFCYDLDSSKKGGTRGRVARDGDANQADLASNSRRLKAARRVFLPVLLKTPSLA